MTIRNIRKCLVTGGAGFIGSHLVETLANDGIEVRALARYNSRRDPGWLREVPGELTDRIEVVFGDVRDAEQMRKAVDGVDTVFHLAALVGIPYSYEGPRQNVETNTIGTLNLLEAARDAGVERFVHTSTSEVYGTAQYVPIDERHPLVGQSPYSASKIGADQLVASFVRSFGVPAVTVRPFNTFGPRQSMRAVIPTIITQCLWGDRIELGSLAPTRDFTFVRDTAAGFYCAGKATGVEGEVFNLGWGKEITVGDLAVLIRDMVGRDVEVARDGARLRPQASEVERLCSDATKAREALGWEPRYPLADGLRATIEWIRSRGREYAVAEFVV